MSDESRERSRPSVLLAVDRPAAMRAASTPARALAAHFGGQIRVLTVGDAANAEAGRGFVRDAVRHLGEAGADAAGEFVEAGRRHVWEAIVEEARRLEPLVLVVASRAPTDLNGLLRGSVAHHLIGHAPCPVMVVPLRFAEPAAPSPGLLERVVLAVDAKGETEHAAEFLERLVGRGAHVEVVHVRPAETVLATAAGAAVGGVGEGVWPLETELDAEALIASYAAGLRERGVRVTARVVESAGGPVGERILEAAREYTARLIVMGSRGLSDLEGVIHGSVAHGVIAGSHCPVIVVR